MYSNKLQVEIHCGLLHERTDLYEDITDNECTCNELFKIKDYYMLNDGNLSVAELFHKWFFHCLPFIYRMLAFGMAIFVSNINGDSGSRIVCHFDSI